MSNLSKKISHYLTSESRNKIIIHKDPIPEFSSLNIGEELSAKLKSIIGSKHFALKAKQILENILNHAIINDKQYGKMLFIYNLGVLFEPELKIDFLALIDKYSKGVTLFIKWDGEVEENKLYFLSKENGITINIENLSHIRI